VRLRLKTGKQAIAYPLASLVIEALGANLTSNLGDASHSRQTPLCIYDNEHRFSELDIRGCEMTEARITRAVQLAEKVLQMELYNQGLHLAECERYSQLSTGQKRLNLNLGCGNKLKRGWCNVDMFAREADFRFDLRENWPFADHAAHLIYCEHFFEHLEYPIETSHFLQESLRVLEIGGLLHVGVPGTAWLMRSYGKPQSYYWSLAKTIWHPASCKTQMQHINHHFRQEGQHQYAWDTETLIEELKMHGFENAARRRWISDLDSADRRVNSIYVVARKLCDAGDMVPINTPCHANDNVGDRS